MLEKSWLWFVISKEYVELTRPKIESRDPIFFTGTRSRSRVSGNDRLFPRGSEFGPNLEIPAGPAIQLRPGPAGHADMVSDGAIGKTWVSRGLTLRQANMQRGKWYGKYSLRLIFTFYLNRDTSVIDLFPVVVFQ